MRQDWEISPAELKQLIDSGEPLYLCDVREADEFDICRIIGSKLHPLSQFRDATAEIPNDRLVITICHHGVRSLNAAAHLKQELGYTNVRSLAGGIERWAREIDPKVPRY